MQPCGASLWRMGDEDVVVPGGQAQRGRDGLCADLVQLRLVNRDVAQVWDDGRDCA